MVRSVYIVYTNITEQNREMSKITAMDAVKVVNKKPLPWMLPALTVKVVNKKPLPWMLPALTVKVVNKKPLPWMLPALTVKVVNKKPFCGVQYNNYKICFLIKRCNHCTVLPPHVHRCYLMDSFSSQVTTPTVFGLVN